MFTGVTLWLNNNMLIHSSTQLLTLPGGPQRGPDLGRLGIIENGAVLIRDEKIMAVGPTDELRQAFREAAKLPRNKGILQAVDEPLVSVDYKGDPHSSSVDLPFTSVLGKEKSDFLKVVAWYDNEWGYSVRTADLANLMAGKL